MHVHALRDPASFTLMPNNARARGSSWQKPTLPRAVTRLHLKRRIAHSTLEPNRADVLGLRALALMRLGEPEQARQSMAHALRFSEPEDPALQNNMGWLLCETGKAAESLPYFDRALSHRRYAAPANAAMNAGTCSLRLNDRDRAERYFQRALQADARSAGSQVSTSAACRRAR
jgi:Tfp pilus assembly protein PilF